MRRNFTSLDCLAGDVVSKAPWLFTIMDYKTAWAECDSRMTLKLRRYITEEGNLDVVHKMKLTQE